jgi:hypothetical protein
VREWKQTSCFTEVHAAYVTASVHHARRLVTTPHVIAEATNLSVGLPRNLRTRYWQVLRAFVERTKERWVRARDAVQDEQFPEFGLADVAQSLLRRSRPVVVTVDAGLFSLLSKRRLPVMNLNHLAFPIDS